MTPAELMAYLALAKSRDRRLNAEIAVFLDPRRHYLPEDREIPGTYWIRTTDGDHRLLALDYTGSIDDALTLLPEGRRWSVSGDPVAETACAIVESTSAGFEDDYNAATPALAICLAALKARAE